MINVNINMFIFLENKLLITGIHFFKLYFGQGVKVIKAVDVSILTPRPRSWILMVYFILLCAPSPQSVL